MVTPKHNTEFPPPKDDLSEQPFGHLVAQRYLGHSRWECLCKCGHTTTARAIDLLSRHKKSCGCLKRERLIADPHHVTHGLTKHPIYRQYKNMINRCYNPRVPGFPLYGGRGITVCERWRSSVANFYTDMGAPPPGMTLERLDNDGPYSPENCVWASPKQQARNRRTSHFLTHDGETHTMAAWAEKLHLNVRILQGRIQGGWSAGRALTTPMLGAHTYPETVSHGDAHYSRTHPELLARGARHGSKTHPESFRRGTQHHSAKLTKEDVREIRHRFRDSQGKYGIKARLARDFGVSKQLIGAVLQGKRYGDVE